RRGRRGEHRSQGDSKPRIRGYASVKGDRSWAAPRAETVEKRVDMRGEVVRRFLDDRARDLVTLAGDAQHVGRQRPDLRLLRSCGPRRNRVREGEPQLIEQDRQKL